MRNEPWITETKIHIFLNFHWWRKLIKGSAMFSQCYALLFTVDYLKQENYYFVPNFIFHNNSVSLYSNLENISVIIEPSFYFLVIVKSFSAFVHLSILLTSTAQSCESRGGYITIGLINVVAGNRFQRFDTKSDGMCL